MSTYVPASSASRDPQNAGFGPFQWMQWGPVLAGALTAAALGFVLDSFGAAIGLAVSSTAPTWRDSSMMLQLLSGLYLILVAMTAFGVGGYIAGPLSKDQRTTSNSGTGAMAWWSGPLL